MGIRTFTSPANTKQPAPREPKRKKTLQEAAGERLHEIALERREATMRDVRERQRRDEEETAAMTYGPNWREQCQWAGPEERPRLSLVPPQGDEDDESAAE